MDRTLSELNAQPPAIVHQPGMTSSAESSSPEAQDASRSRFRVAAILIALYVR